MTFRLLFVGDVVGPAGCSAVLDLVPDLRERLRLDAVVANAENSAPGGRGITEESGVALLSVVDFLTLGNHAFDAKGYEKYLEREGRIARPANLGNDLPGRGWGTFEANGVTVGVANVLGRVFIDRTSLSPFVAADEALAQLRGADLVLVDAHAEATSEKQALGYHLAGRAQAVLGTHTHVSTADATVLPGGTAYATDVGMTGCEESIIGFDREGFLGLFLGERRRLPVATRGPVLFSGALVDFDLDDRRATSIEPVLKEWKP
ncbi:MAG: YmdB family metallophosphoesterase [Actinomycetota bacterium]|nr:YmdB family metallophosphoesterase [Actinomycetota bacterium]